MQLKEIHRFVDGLVKILQAKVASEEKEKKLPDTSRENYLREPNL